MLNKKQIYNKLHSVSIDDIARQTGFTARVGGKITPMNFVLSFFLSIQLEKHNFGTWAEQLGALIKETFSYNGLKKAQNTARAKFAKALLSSTINKQLSSKGSIKFKTALLAQFNRVFIEDSTCIKLPKHLYKFFPGAFSKTGKAATAKIQCRQELKSGNYFELVLQHFRNNDQSFAAQILKSLKKGDLVIRDMGYFVLDVFKEIDKLSALFLSRLKTGVKLYDCQTGQEFDLAKRLRKAARNKESIVELELNVGKKAQLRARVCAIKCPAKVTRKRRQALKKNRDQRKNPSRETIELLGWTIFITNIPSKTLSGQQILEVYGYRWRIEIIFKVWKSHFNLDQLLNTKAKLKKEQVEIAFYLFLVWVTLFFARMYNFHLHQIYSTKHKILSLLKYAKFVKEHLTEFLQNPELDYWTEHLAYYCCYQKRKDRLNFCEQLYLII